MSDAVFRKKAIFCAEREEERRREKCLTCSWAAFMCSVRRPYNAPCSRDGLCVSIYSCVVNGLLACNNNNNAHKIYQKMLPMPLFIFDKRLSLGRQHRFHSSIRAGYHFYYYLFAKMDIDRYRCRFTVAPTLYGHNIIIIIIIAVICDVCSVCALCVCLGISWMCYTAYVRYLHAVERRR